jgi:hypothetical protein
MTRPKSIARTDQIVAKIQRIASQHQENFSTENLDAVLDHPVEIFPDSVKLPRLKRFRFQLLHQWLIQSFKPCRVADIGGGKGLLSYLLQRSGWDVTVIDPEIQALPAKFKDIETQTRVRIDPETAVSYIQAPFRPHLAADFDLLVAMHAHGCNAAMIDAAAEHGCGFVIFPCCVIDEPFFPPPGVLWLESLAHYALQQGISIQAVRLNFKGQNVGLYTHGKRT